MIHAEFDSVQVAIIVLAVIFSFLKWLWEQWRGKTEETTPAPVDEIERQLREEAWRRQTGQQPAAPAPPPVPRPIPQPLPSPQAPSNASPWEEIRKAWKELREVSQQQQAPARPVQPPPASPPQRRAQRTAPPPPPAATPRQAAVPQTPAAPAPSAPPSAAVTTAQVSPMLASLRGLRQDPAALRRAIVIQEVLGPPKALQT
ncbi:MAG: hypothetical protein JNG86_08950 [Verrucomicrobiaceae bacterium]|nr:hypothetical protein [Verrucomicrobiaceae bacterium]